MQVGGSQTLPSVATLRWKGSDLRVVACNRTLWGQIPLPLADSIHFCSRSCHCSMLRLHQLRMPASLTEGLVLSNHIVCPLPPMPGINSALTIVQTGPGSCMLSAWLCWPSSLTSLISIPPSPVMLRGSHFVCSPSRANGAGHTVGTQQISESAAGATWIHRGRQALY